MEKQNLAFEDAISILMFCFIFMPLYCAIPWIHV